MLSTVQPRVPSPPDFVCEDDRLQPAWTAPKPDYAILMYVATLKCFAVLRLLHQRLFHLRKHAEQLQQMSTGPVLLTFRLYH